MSSAYTRFIHAVDSHTEGNPTRIVLSGIPVPPGQSIVERNDWLKHNDDDLRRLLNFEPRANSMMCSVYVFPPISDEADFSVVITEQDEYVPMSGHCIIGTATTVVATGLVKHTEPSTPVVFETPAGLVRCSVSLNQHRTGPVSFRNVESFLLHENLIVTTASGDTASADVAYGGCFYALVDADALGLDLVPTNEQDIIAQARSIIGSLNSRYEIRHPDLPYITRCYQTLFYSKHSSKGDVRQIIVAPPGTLDRSPCGTGASAHLATLVARGMAEQGQRVTFEGPLGTTFSARALEVESRDGRINIIPEVTGRAWITGFHHFVLDPEDPFPAGYRLGDPPRDQKEDGIWAGSNR